MQKKTCVKILLIVTIYSALTACFVFFFMIDQLTAFIKGRTTVSQRLESADILQFPTLIFCMNPATKLSVSKKYGFKTYRDKFNVEVNNSYLDDRFNELSYILNRDYVITSTVDDDMKLKEGLNIISELRGPDKYNFNVEPIRTFYHGTCTKIEPNFEVTRVPLRFELEVTINDNIVELDDKPKYINLHFTSNKTWIGLTDYIFPQLTPPSEDISFQQEFTNFILREEEKYFDEGVENNRKCLHDYLILSRNCTFKCNTLSYGDLPTCKTIAQLKCMKGTGFGTEYNDCYKTPKASTYKVDRVENPYHVDINESSTKLYIGMWSRIKEIQEEVPLLSPQDFIGSIGGSLGMFFGFSFSATLLSCIEKFLNKVF